MWHWFNLNVGAVQALSSALQALSSLLTVTVTVVLVIITRRYVALTEKLAEAANSQLLRQNQETRSRRRKLKSAIQFLNSALETLPIPGRRDEADDMMRRSCGWDGFDFEGFRDRAAEISEQAGGAATRAEASMDWIAELRREIKETPTGVGYDWSGFPWAEWVNRLTSAGDGLRLLYQGMGAKASGSP